MTTPTGLPEWAASQASPDVVVNEQVRRLEAGASAYVVVDKDLTAPPGSCGDGATYIVAGSPTGAWSGHAKDLAIAVSANAASGWYFRTPVEGVQAYLQDENLLYRYSGAAWASAGGGDLLAANNLSDLANAGTARTNLDVYSTAQVDGKVNGLSWKQAVRAASTANGALATAFENGDTLDGVTLATGDRILLKNQSSAAENGIYVVAASGAPARAADADSGAELVNASIFVSEGTANADTNWTCSTNAPITPGATSLTFVQSVSGGGGLLAANNLSDVANAATARGNLGAAAAAPAIQSVTSSATVTPTFADDMVIVTAQAAALALANPTGSAVHGWGIVIRIKDDGTARAITYDTQYRALGVTLPTTTVLSKTLYLAMIYNATDTKWDVVAVAQQA